MGEGMKPFPRADHEEMKLLVYGVADLPVSQNKALTLVETSSKTSQWNPYTLLRVFQWSATAELHETLLLLSLAWSSVFIKSSNGCYLEAWRPPTVETLDIVQDNGWPWVMKAFAFFFFFFKVGEWAKEIVGKKSPSVWMFERSTNLFHLG